MLSWLVGARSRQRQGNVGKGITIAKTSSTRTFFPEDLLAQYPPSLLAVVWVLTLPAWLVCSLCVYVLNKLKSLTGRRASEKRIDVAQQVGDDDFSLPGPGLQRLQSHALDNRHGLLQSGDDYQYLMPESEVQRFKSHRVDLNVGMDDLLFETASTMYASVGYLQPAMADLAATVPATATPDSAPVVGDSAPVDGGLSREGAGHTFPVLADTFPAADTHTFPAADTTSPTTCAPSTPPGLVQRVRSAVSTCVGSLGLTGGNNSAEGATTGPPPADRTSPSTDVTAGGSGSGMIRDVSFANAAFSGVGSTPGGTSTGVDALYASPGGGTTTPPNPGALPASFNANASAIGEGPSSAVGFAPRGPGAVGSSGLGAAVTPAGTDAAAGPAGVTTAVPNRYMDAAGPHTSPVARFKEVTTFKGGGGAFGAGGPSAVAARADPAATFPSGAVNLVQGAGSGAGFVFNPTGTVVSPAGTAAAATAPAYATTAAAPSLSTAAADRQTGGTPLFSGVTDGFASGAGGPGAAGGPAGATAAAPAASSAADPSVRSAPATPAGGKRGLAKFFSSLRSLSKRDKNNGTLVAPAVGDDNVAGGTTTTAAGSLAGVNHAGQEDESEFPTTPTAPGQRTLAYPTPEGSPFRGSPPAMTGTSAYTSQASSIAPDTSAGVLNKVPGLDMLEPIASMGYPKPKLRGQESPSAVIPPSPTTSTTSSQLTPRSKSRRMKVLNCLKPNFEGVD